MRTLHVQHNDKVRYDIRFALSSLRKQLDLFHIIQNKNIPLENKELEYKTAEQKMLSILEKVERYSLKDNETT